MIRRLIPLATAISLLVCIATCALWLRSYRTADEIKVEHASYPYVGIVDDEPMYKDRITNVAIGANRGAIGVDVRRSAGEGYLAVDNLPDWREFHPDGTSFRYDHDPAYLLVTQFPFVDLHDSRVLFDHAGVFVGRYSIDGLMAGTIDFTGHVVTVPA